MHIIHINTTICVITNACRRNTIINIDTNIILIILFIKNIFRRILYLNVINYSL
jgi:hypothetical protein